MKANVEILFNLIIIIICIASYVYVFYNLIMLKYNSDNKFALIEKIFINWSTDPIYKIYSLNNQISPFTNKCLESDEYLISYNWNGIEESCDCTNSFTNTFFNLFFRLGENDINSLGEEKSSYKKIDHNLYSSSCNIFQYLNYCERINPINGKRMNSWRGNILCSKRKKIHNFSSYKSLNNELIFEEHYIPTHLLYNAEMDEYSLVKISNANVLNNLSGKENFYSFSVLICCGSDTLSNLLCYKNEYDTFKISDIFSSLSNDEDICPINKITIINNNLSDLKNNKTNIYEENVKINDNYYLNYLKYPIKIYLITDNFIVVDITENILKLTLNKKGEENNIENLSANKGQNSLVVEVKYSEGRICVLEDNIKNIIIKDNNNVNARLRINENINHLNNKNNSTNSTDKKGIVKSSKIQFSKQNHILNPSLIYYEGMNYDDSFGRILSSYNKEKFINSRVSENYQEENCKTFISTNNRDYNYNKLDSYSKYAFYMDNKVNDNFFEAHDYSKYNNIGSFPLIDHMAFLSQTSSVYYKSYISWEDKKCMNSKNEIKDIVFKFRNNDNLLIFNLVFTLVSFLFYCLYLRIEKTFLKMLFLITISISIAIILKYLYFIFMFGEKLNELFSLRCSDFLTNFSFSEFSWNYINASLKMFKYLLMLLFCLFSIFLLNKTIRNSYSGLENDLNKKEYEVETKICESDDYIENDNEKYIRNVNKNKLL